MRIVVFSDSHGSAQNVYEIIERHKDNADLFLFLGDGYNDTENALMLYPNINIDRVCGNCDFTCPLPASKTITFNGKKILFTHGHPYYVKHGYQVIEEEAKKQNVDFCFFGHTHIKYIEKLDGIYYMNPGTASRGEYGIIDIIGDKANVYITEV